MPSALLNAGELIAASRIATGLSDFGAIDPRESLERLVASLNEEAYLTDTGAASKKASLVRVLSNRLLLQDALLKQPQIEAETIRGPVVITGLQRSGTTKLHRMIAADPSMQKLPLWKLLYPVQTAALRPGQLDPRISAAQAFVDVMRERSPDMYAAHPMMALEPDEEYFAMEISFQAHINTSSFRTPSYEAWLNAQSFDNWYVWLKKFLQYAQHTDGGASRPWVLKAPHHLGYLPLLFKYFPDATVVHCHRSPAVAIASFSGLLLASRRATSYRTSAAEVGDYCLRYCSQRLQDYLRDRAFLEQSRPFTDIPYRDIVSESPAAIRRIYAAAGLELTGEAMRAMGDWETANRQHKHGSHRYALADFGLTEGQIVEATQAYSRRFSAFLD
jgi:Sulfotransferase family